MAYIHILEAISGHFEEKLPSKNAILFIWALTTNQTKGDWKMSKSCISLTDLSQKASSYLKLASHSDQKVEAFKTVLLHEIETAYEERRHEDYVALGDIYHDVIMSVPIFD